MFCDFIGSSLLNIFSMLCKGSAYKKFYFIAECSIKAMFCHIFCVAHHHRITVAILVFPSNGLLS